MPRSTVLQRAWASTTVSSRVPELGVETIRRWLRDLPPPRGYALSVKSLRYRTAPHLLAFCWYEEHLIELRVPEPFRVWSERVYYRARRKPGKVIDFKWYFEAVRFRTRREVLRFLYCHEFYHWYLKEVRHRKAAAETACDRFALKFFRRRNHTVNWRLELPGYDPIVSAALRRSA